MMKYVIYLLTLLPILGLSDTISAIDPYDSWLEFTGLWTVIWLGIAVLIGPLARCFKIPKIMWGKQPLGLAAFSWMVLHLLGYLWFSLDIAVAITDVFTKPFLLLGLLSFVIFFKMAATSTQWAIKKMGRGWNALHGAVVLAAGLGGAHGLVAQKVVTTEMGLVSLALIIVVGFRYTLEYWRHK